MDDSILAINQFDKMLFKTDVFSLRKYLEKHEFITLLESFRKTGIIHVPAENVE